MNFLFNTPICLQMLTKQKVKYIIIPNKIVLNVGVATCGRPAKNTKEDFK